MSRRTSVMSAISSVIVPGLGPVCPECFSRGHIAAFPLAHREVYSFSLTGPPSQLDWDVATARALIAARPRTPRRLDSSWLAVWLQDRSNYDIRHIDHI